MCLSLHLHSCLSMEVKMSIRGCILFLLVSNQSMGGVIVFVAVSLPTLFTFLTWVLLLFLLAFVISCSILLQMAFVVSSFIIFSQSVLVVSFLSFILKASLLMCIISITAA